MPTDQVADYGDVLDLQMLNLKSQGKMYTQEYHQLWKEKWEFERAQKSQAWDEGQNDYSEAEEEPE